MQLDQEIENREILKNISTFADFFKILIAYEEQDTDFIEYQSKMLKKNLEKKYKLFPFEKKMLSFFFTHAINFSYRKEKDISLFKKIKSEMELTPKADLLGGGVYKGFDFMAWIESKSKGITLQQLLKNKSS